MGTNKNYNELCTLKTYDERLAYLKAHGNIFEETFGPDRIYNQMFYRSKDWADIRRKVIKRDGGHDLGLEDNSYEIHGRIYVHHINPITIDDIKNNSPKLLDMNNLICASYDTHQSIHYDIDPPKIIERTANDTCPWKR